MTHILNTVFIERNNVWRTLVFFNYNLFSIKILAQLINYILAGVKLFTV